VGLIRASLHESGTWRFAFTPEFAVREFGDDHHIHDARLIDRWQRPPEITKGVTLAFRIIIPESELNPFPLADGEDEQVEWIAPPIDKHIVEVDVIITKPFINTTDWPGKDSMGTHFLASSLLPNGETLWLVYLYAEVQEAWLLDREKFKSQLRRIKPRFSHARNLLKAKNPRIMVMGFYSDGSRYFMDLSAKEFINISFYLRSIYLSIVDRIATIFGKD
jgi:hypothetical protein